MDMWRSIVDSNIGWLAASVRRIVGNNHDAEDVVQEVFVEAYALAQKTQVENWPALLRRMSQRRAIDQLRRKVRTAKTASSELMAMVPSDEDHEQAMEKCDLESQLRKSLVELSDREATVFALTYFEHLSRSEIATTLQTSENAVSIALHKAIKRLKVLLQNPKSTEENQ